MAATGRRIAREMILPGWGFIRREAAVAWRDFYAPFKGILEALQAFGNAKPAEDLSSYFARAGSLSAAKVEVVFGNENDAQVAGADVGMIYGDDVHFGRSGEDLILGAIGNEVLFGEGWNDPLIDDSDKDVLLGGRGDNYLRVDFGKPGLRGATYIPLGDSDSNLESADENDRMLHALAKKYTIKVRGSGVHLLGPMGRPSSVGDVADPYSITLGVVSVSSDDPRGAGSSASKPRVKRSRP